MLLREAKPTSAVAQQSSGSVADEACASLPAMRLKRPSSPRAEMTCLRNPPRLLQSITQADYCPQLIQEGGREGGGGVVEASNPPYSAAQNEHWLTSVRKGWGGRLDGRGF